MLDTDDLCGFCLEELPTYDKVRAMELFPKQDEEWKRYFALLSDSELADLATQAHLEQCRRLAVWAQGIQARNATLYGAIPPPHHRKGYKRDAAA